MTIEEQLNNLTEELANAYDALTSYEIGSLDWETTREYIVYLEKDILELKLELITNTVLDCPIKWVQPTGFTPLTK